MHLLTTAIVSLPYCLAVALLTMSVCLGAEPQRNGASQPRSASSPEQAFVFPRVNPKHRRMTALLENAFGYISPDHGIIDAASGYPVEGWNHDPDRGLFLRSFTQLTAIGQWIELLANIAAGYADNPYISREDALSRLTLAVKNLCHDQRDPNVSAKGLLGNFLGFQGDGRIGPLSRDVAKQDIVDTFGEKKANAIWKALEEKEWIKPENKGQTGVIQRGESYGSKHFDEALEPFSDDETVQKLMEIMDQRIVMVAYGDNANLATSIAKSIGALLSDSLQDNPQAKQLAKEMDEFLDRQQKGYEFLFDEKAEMLSFGWNASTDKYFGWEDLKGNWKVGHSDYLVNEFRGPTMFVLLRYDMPKGIVSNLGFKIKAYTTQSGNLLHTLAPWEGSAFQAFGLSLCMQEMDDPNWSRILRDTVAIELDFADRHRLPGFLSESYSGKGTEYTGSIGVPAITVSPKPRITDAATLYTLGVAYSISPDGVEAMLDRQWDTISTLLTDHGPWEGFNTSDKRVIEFQTSAHMLALILGGLGTASDNMQRYLESKRLNHRLKKLYRPGDPINFLASDRQVIGWSPDGSDLTTKRDDNGFRLQGDDLGEVGITMPIPVAEGANLSGGRLKIRYVATRAINRAVIHLDKKDPQLKEAGVIPIEIFSRFEATGGKEQELVIPLPATPGLSGIKEIVTLCGKNEERSAVDITFIGFEFMPVVKSAENVNKP